MSQKFTGKERDAESGLDYFGARYYGTVLGRFVSPDPENAGAHPIDPQTWNGYAYVSNNPLNGVDPNGLNRISPIIIDGRQVENPFGMFGALGGSGIDECPNGVCSVQTEKGFYQFGELADNRTGFGLVGPRQRSPATPLTDNKGNVVQGANGRPALVPGGFDINGVLEAGKNVKELRRYAPIVGYETTWEELANFNRFGKWDLQRLSGDFDSRFVDSATILIGMYAAAAGISRSTILDVENLIAIGSKYAKGTQMDSTYTHLPARNVTNTDIGMRLVQSGAITVPQD